jgi:hypothetical protein
MAASKSGNQAFLTATANTAASTTNTVGVNLQTADGATITCQIINGTTAPTTACAAICQVSPDNLNWAFYQQQTAGTVASTQYNLAFDLPPSVIFARIQFTGNTGQSVTVSAQSMVVNSL